MFNKGNNIKFSREKGVKFNNTHEKKITFKNSPNSNPDKKLKWWHILLIVLGALLIIGGIIAAVIFGQINSAASSGPVEPPPEIIGVVTTYGTYDPSDANDYVLCEYTELFSGEKVVLFQKATDVRYDYQAHYIFVNENGELKYNHSGVFSGNYTPEQTKQDLFSLLKSVLGYTDERLANCDMVVYDPVSFTKVKLSEVTLTEDNTVTLKFSAGAVDGELSEEVTLTGSYVKDGTAFTFTYSDLPEDELLLAVAEKLLTSAKYESYIMYGAWVNELTFGDAYKLYLRTAQ